MFNFLFQGFEFGNLFENKREMEKDDLEKNINTIIERGAIKKTSLDHFKDLEGYSLEEIEEDQKILDLAKERFSEEENNLSEERKLEKKESRKRGEALEIILTHLLEHWFETDDIEVLVQPTTEFDDVVNGVDLIVEFKIPNLIEPVAFAIDASLHIGGIKEKLVKCYKKMGSAYRLKDVQVKYFQSQFEDNETEDYLCGPLEDIASVVLGLGPKNANILFDDFAEYLFLRDTYPDEAKEKLNLIKENPIKKLFLQQIKAQIDGHLSSPNKIKPKIIDKLEKTSRIVEDILNEMKGVIPTFAQQDDKVLGIIEESFKINNKRSGKIE